MNKALTKFRTIDGCKRRAAMRAYLSGEDKTLSFTASPDSLTPSQLRALTDMAKAVSWRKSIGTPLTLGAAFYVYLGKDEKADLHARQVQNSAPGSKARGPAIQYGRGFA